MTAALIYALCAAVLFATGLILADVGLRYRSARRGAAVSIPTAATFFAAISPFAIDPADFSWRAVALFAIAGLGYPALVTLLTFEAARRVGPGIAAAFIGYLVSAVVVTGTLGLGGEPPAARPQGRGILCFALAGLATGSRYCFCMPRSVSRR